MKKFLLALVALMTVTVSARAMSYEQACRQALFLTDKMAYELNLTDEQYEAAYEVNLDYLMSISNYDELYGIYWQQRNLDLSYILLDWQYRAYLNASYFYRPLYWRDGFWHFSIYARYPHRDYFFFGRPHFYNVYRGGHSWAHNGGHSWYHGRNYGPQHGRDHFGMRDGFDRGDFGRGHRGLDNGAGRPNVGNGPRGSRGDVQQPRGGNRDMNGNSRPRSSFGGAKGGVEHRQDVGNGNRPSMRNGSERQQQGSSSEARPRSNFDRSTSSHSMRESSTRQTVTRQGTAPSRSISAPSRSTSTAPSRSIGSSSRSMSTAPSRSISAPSRSTSSAPSRSYSAPSRSSSSSMSRSSGFSSSSRSSSSISHGGGASRGGGHFGGRR